MPCVQIDHSVTATSQGCNSQSYLAYEAETLLENTFGYVDYKYLINRKLKNARLCPVFADPVTYGI